VDTLLAGAGVSATFGNLVVAMLRAGMCLPAVVSGVRAGPVPDGLHAVAEASSRALRVVDGTLLAPAADVLVRIATGRDGCRHRLP